MRRAARSSSTATLGCLLAFVLCGGTPAARADEPTPAAAPDAVEPGRLYREGVKLYVDAMSAMYLQGVTIDYIVGLQGAGFKFINPHAKSTCGCGQSFST